MSLDDFDHPCRNSCSGWKQGYDRGRLDMKERLQIATEALNKCKIYSECYEELIMTIDEALKKIENMK